MKNIKVMTFNMKNDSLLTTKIRNFQSRKVAIISIIHKYKPDVIGVQELAIPMKYELSRSLPEYCFNGKSRSKGTKNSNEHTDILVLKDKFEIVKQETFWLTNSPTVEGSRLFLSLFPRICTYVTIKDLNSNQIYRIFNSHLDPIFESTRIKQISALVNHLNEIHETSPLPTVIMGDFNCKPNSSSIKYLDSHPLGFKSVYYSQPKSNTLHFFSGKSKPEKSPIDYIYISSDMELSKLNIITDKHNGVYPSDHFPVFAELKLNL